MAAPQDQLGMTGAMIGMPATDVSIGKKPRHWPFRLLSDTRGKVSWTHSLAIPIVILLTFKLLASGIAVQFGGYSLTLASISGADYVEMVKYWIGLFLARETTEKVIGYLNGSSDTTPTLPT